MIFIKWNLSVTISTDPGTFEFSKPSFVFKESAGVAAVEVKRSNGCDGKAVVHWRTVDHRGDNAAVAGRDYQSGEGDLVFEHGELSKTIEIQIEDDQVSSSREDDQVSSAREDDQVSSPREDD